MACPSYCPVPARRIALVGGGRTRIGINAAFTGCDAIC